MSGAVKFPVDQYARAKVERGTLVAIAIDRPPATGGARRRDRIELTAIVTPEQAERVLEVLRELLRAPLEAPKLRPVTKPKTFFLNEGHELPRGRRR